MVSRNLEKPQAYLWFTYSETRTGGQAINPEDEDIEFSLRGCYNAAEKISEWLKEQVDLNFKVKVGDEVHVVVVRYTTGGSFGRTMGAWYIEGVYKTAKKADKVEKAIWSGKYKGHKPWVGYFEKLEYVQIETMMVE